MCRCRGICKYRKATDKDRLLGRCIHGIKGARYSHKLGFNFAPGCDYCKERERTVQ